MELSDDIVKLLSSKNFGILATLMDDGSPHATVVWVDYRDGYVLINTAVGRVKQKNVSRDPRVSLCVIDSSNPYHMVSIRGRVVEQVHEGADEHIDRLAERYLGLSKYPFKAQGEERVILKVKVEHVYHQRSS